MVAELPDDQLGEVRVIVVLSLLRLDPAGHGAGDFAGYLAGQLAVVAAGLELVHLVSLRLIIPAAGTAYCFPGRISLSSGQQLPKKNE